MVRFTLLSETAKIQTKHRKKVVFKMLRSKQQRTVICERWERKEVRLSLPQEVLRCSAGSKNCR